MKAYTSKNARVFLIGEKTNEFLVFNFGYFGSNLPDEIEIWEFDNPLEKMFIEIPKEAITHTFVLAIDNQLKIVPQTSN